VWGAEIASLSPEAKARVEIDRMLDYLLFVDGEAVGVLENQVRKIQGVRDVENLLHLPGVEPQMHQ
jgi:hypothetical protein